jgi:hypothetical protein
MPVLNCFKERERERLSLSSLIKNMESSKSKNPMDKRIIGVF